MEALLIKMQRLTRTLELIRQKGDSTSEAEVVVSYGLDGAAVIVDRLRLKEMQSYVAN